jgi:hypothetical protein
MIRGPQAKRTYTGAHPGVADDLHASEPISAQACARWHKVAQESQVLLIAEPLELDYQHKIIRWINQERDQALAVRAEMQ